MIIQHTLSTPEWAALARKYTTINKRPPTWHDAYRPNYIMLYHKRGDIWYFPPSARWQGYKEEKKLSEPLVYTADESWVPEDMIEEQDSIYGHMMLDDWRWGMVVMKTGRGKGNMILKMCEGIQQKTLIITNTVNNLHDLVARFKKSTNYEVGEWHGKKKDIQDITVTTHTSFSKDVSVFSWHFGVLMYDECDYRMTKKMIHAICTVDVEAVYGFTGTPRRQEIDSDDLTLFFWGFYKWEDQDNNGYNILPTIYRIIYKWERLVRENFHELKDWLSEDEDRLEKQVSLVKKTCDYGTKVWLVLTDRVQDCLEYCERLNKIWVRAWVMHGKTKPEDDKKLIEEITEHGGVIVGNYQKVGRWQDIPSISNMYLFFATKFEGNVVQAVWRWLRAYPWKDVVRLYDWVDENNLARQGYERQQAYEREYKNVDDEWNVTTCKIKRVVIKEEDKE